MLIAQITDMHVRPYAKPCYGRVETNAHLRQAVRALGELRPAPDLVLATGDLVDRGSIEEYEILRDLLSPLTMPVYLIPGNHDDRANLRAVFADAYLRQDDRFLHYVVDRHPVRLIGLDTLVPGSPDGELCADRLRWLSHRLAERPDQPTVLFMHHPPFASGLGHMDRFACVGSEPLAALVRAYPRIERVLCGHQHRSVQMRWAGTLASIAPSTAHQMTFDTAPDAPLAFVMEPPGFHLHLWREDTGVVTHQLYVGPHAGPYPIRPAAGTGGET
ncbi:MAG: phosphodiesterase [Alphaproteobacteria bacterium]|nr:phosphodiesterase [Alphaproteobacteria bacterium]